MLPLPAKATSRIDLADWLELLAITSRGKTSSPGALERVLQREAIYHDRGRAIEEMLASVVAELEARSGSAGNGYPFDLAGGVLTFRPDAWTTRSTYLFCLGLTNYGNRPDGRGTFPERIFEFVSTGAAGNFIGGEAVRFGSPRHVRELPPAFAAAVEAVSVKLGEGGGFSKRPTHWTKDWGVDLVAWRPLPDRLPGQLVLFGGCASGKDWDEKLSECNPDVWCKAWMSRQPESQILKAFFLPRRLDGADSWTLMSYQAGIIFDRCRLAHWLPALPEESHHGRGIRWTKAAFRDLASRN
jgi:hypothetical protein